MALPHRSNRFDLRAFTCLPTDASWRRGLRCLPYALGQSRCECHQLSHFGDWPLHPIHQSIPKKILLLRGKNRILFRVIGILIDEFKYPFREHLFEHRTDVLRNLPVGRTPQRPRRNSRGTPLYLIRMFWKAYLRVG